MSVKITGQAEIMATVRGLEAKMQRRIAKAINDAANDLLKEAISRTPIDTGDLRKSGNINSASSGDLVASVGFATPYALRLHESANYTARQSGTGPKYLQNPYNENRARYEKDIAEAVKAELK